MEINGKDLWNLLVELEPRLEELRKVAANVKDDGSGKHFCANAIWYGYSEDRPRIHSLKYRLCRLVGWDSEHSSHPILGTTDAYDIAYNTVYEMLPNCRNCSCL